MGEFHGFLCIVIFCRTRSALIECHDYVGSDCPLDIHDPFGREQVFGAVDMGAEFYAFFFQLAYARKRKHLKTAAIGQHRTVKPVEFMQPSGSFKHFKTWTKVQMIGIS